MRFPTVLTYLGCAAVVGLVIHARFAAPRLSASSDDELATNRPTTAETHRVTPVMLREAARADGADASPFAADATDGRSTSLSDLTMSRPLVLLFIQDGCPCSEAAQPFFNDLHAAYGDRVQFAGVIDGDLAAARAWAVANHVPFRILADPDLEIVKHYQVKNSAYSVLIQAGGRIETMWPGYSESMLRDLGNRLARLARTPPHPLSVSTAPTEMYSGCPYPLD